MDKPTLKELKKILDEQADAISQILLREGYALKVPRAEWSNAKSALIITKEHGEQEISDFELQNILDGRKKASKEDVELIYDWYKTSSYRYGHETHKCTEQLKKANEKKDRKLAWHLEHKLKNLSEEYRKISQKESIKRDLARCYNESGKRLERLYQILWGDNETIEAKFGTIKMHISKNAYHASIKEKEYSQSKGFFEDIKNAFAVARAARAPIEYSQSTGAIYSNEWINGTGDCFLDIGGRKLVVSAEIKKDGLKNQMGVLLRIPLHVQEDALSEKVRLFLDDYDVEQVEDTWVVTNNTAGLRAGYLSSKDPQKSMLLFGGDPANMETELDRFLRAVLS